jgi:hypothetical protein
MTLRSAAGLLSLALCIFTGCSTTRFSPLTQQVFPGYPEDRVALEAGDSIDRPFIITGVLTVEDDVEKGKLTNKTELLKKAGEAAAKRGADMFAPYEFTSGMETAMARGKRTKYTLYGILRSLTLRTEGIAGMPGVHPAGTRISVVRDSIEESMLQPGMRLKRVLRKVAIGQSKEEVITILGPPDDQDDDDRGFSTFSYSCETPDLVKGTEDIDVTLYFAEHGLYRLEGEGSHFFPNAR